MSMIGNALSLFRSALKGGEPWSEECQAAFDAAQRELQRLRLPACCSRCKQPHECADKAKCLRE